MCWLIFAQVNIWVITYIPSRNVQGQQPTEQVPLLLLNAHWNPSPWGCCPNQHFP